MPQPIGYLLIVVNVFTRITEKRCVKETRDVIDLDGDEWRLGLVLQVQF